MRDNCQKFFFLNGNCSSWLTTDCFQLQNACKNNKNFNNLTSVLLSDELIGKGGVDPWDTGDQTQSHVELQL